MQAIGLIFVLAVLVEGVVEYFGSSIPTNLKAYTAAALGIITCVLYNADLLAVLGYPALFPYVGSVLTGLVIGRGSNYLNDFVSRLQVISAPATSVKLAERIPASPSITSEGEGS